MIIYRCNLTLMESTFFSSREISNLYMTEPLLGNYALAYAFGFCQAPYHNQGEILYREHLGDLNNRGLYITPGTFSEQPRFILRQFNAQTDAYWSAFGTGFIAARSPHGWSEKKGQHWHPVDDGVPGSRFRPTNRPQHGRLRMLAIGNQAICYIISREPLTLPRYIRLGKFMSKAHVDSRQVGYEVGGNESHQVSLLLNPADLSEHHRLGVFDLISVPPAPLVRNAQISGGFYKLEDGTRLPAGMRFNVGELSA